MSALPIRLDKDEQRTMEQALRLSGTTRQVIILPFDLEAAIAEAAKASIERMRAAPPPTEEQLVEEGRLAAEQGWWLEWMRENRDMLAMVALMPVAILGVAWIAEQTMRSM